MNVVLNNHRSVDTKYMYMITHIYDSSIIIAIWMRIITSFRYMQCQTSIDKNLCFTSHVFPVIDTRLELSTLNLELQRKHRAKQTTWASDAILFVPWSYLIHTIYYIAPRFTLIFCATEQQSTPQLLGITMHCSCAPRILQPPILQCKVVTEKPLQLICS